LDDCELLCYQHDNCVSINIKKYPDSATGQQECELNNSPHMEHGEDLTADNVYLYRGAKVILFAVTLFNFFSVIRTFYMYKYRCFNFLKDEYTVVAKRLSVFGPNRCI